MTEIAKCIMVDRVLEKLTDEQMAEIRGEYADYCRGLYGFVNDIKIPNNEARTVVFQAMLSPYQYFIEDVVRMKRLKENRLEAGQPAKPAPAAAAPAKKPWKEWKNRY
jgi:hypothetical protein